MNQRNGREMKYLKMKNLTEKKETDFIRRTNVMVMAIVRKREVMTIFNI